MDSQIVSQKVRNSLCPQNCDVCGDTAIGHHYQIPACNGCKNFFRRSILGMKIFKPCPIEGRCLTTENRIILRRCRACRFSRCIEAGMNPLCVVSEVPIEHNPLIQQVLRLRKIGSAPHTHRQARDLRSYFKLLLKTYKALEVSPKSPEVLINRLIDQLAFLERAHEKIRRSCYSPVREDHIPLVEIIRGHSKLANDYGAPMVLRNPTDKKKLYLDKFSKCWPHADLVYAIEYLKTFEVFHRLNAEEQRLLVRRVIVICAHLTASYFSYKMKSQVTYHPDGSAVKMTCVQESPQQREYHFDSVERIRILEMDQNEYVLPSSSAIRTIPILALDGLSDHSRDILHDQRSRYAQSLFSYMNARRGSHKAPGQFVEMLQLIEWLRGVSERRKEQHLLRAAIGLRPWYCPEGSSDKPVLQDEIFL